MSDVKNILVTGGAGFIGSHTCVELLQAGYGVVIIDDLSNSCEKAVNRIAQIVKQAEADGKAPAGASERMKFYEDNVLNRDALELNTMRLQPCLRMTSHKMSVLVMLL